MICQEQNERTHSLKIEKWIQTGELNNTIKCFTRKPENIKLNVERKLGDYIIVREEDMRRWITRVTHGIYVEKINFLICYIHYCAIGLDIVMSRHSDYFQIMHPALVNADESIICFLQPKHRLVFYKKDKPVIEQFRVRPICFQFALPELEKLEVTGSVCKIAKIDFKQTDAVITVKSQDEIRFDSYHLYIYEDNVLQFIVREKLSN